MRRAASDLRDMARLEAVRVAMVASAAAIAGNILMRTLSIGWSVDISCACAVLCCAGERYRMAVFGIYVCLKIDLKDAPHGFSTIERNGPL